MSERESLPSGRTRGRHRYAMMDAWHPGIILTYVIVIVVVACTMPHILLLSICLVSGCILLVQADGPRGLRTGGAALVLGCAVMVLAPFFDTAGDQVLFSYFGRVYTLEALLRGMQTGLLVAVMLVWFSYLFRIVDSDGILQVCGRVAPRIGMVTSLVVQMVPRLTRRAARVRSARVGARLALPDSGFGAKAREAGAVFSTVAADSLERSIVCADAMESRGYGTGTRTNAALASFSMEERAFIICAVVLFVAFSMIAAMSTMNGSRHLSAMVPVVYGLFALLPVLFNAAEGIRWRI